jgi:membrane dipeptidase
MTQNIPVFDGHNDLLLRMTRAKGDPVRAFLDGDPEGHLDLPRMRTGNFVGGFFAIYVPSKSIDGEEGMAAYESDMALQDWPLPPALELVEGQRVTLHMASLLLRIERASEGRFKICRTAAEIQDCVERGVIAALMHIEGAEAIDPDLHMLDVLYAAGLRSVGPVWSRPTIFGHGVPYRFPSTPDVGPGLTDRGRALVRACNKLRILIDLSHLNEQGFWDVAKLSSAPLVATHSNAHALCPHSRNLTDKQLAAVRESGGIVGVTFEGAFIRADGRRDANTDLEELVRHVDYLIQRLGIDGVGLGSDFDGAILPNEIGDVGGLPRLIQAMRRHGYDEATLHKVCYQNWLDVLERTCDR